MDATPAGCSLRNASGLKRPLFIFGPGIRDHQSRATARLSGWSSGALLAAASALSLFLFFKKENDNVLHLWRGKLNSCRFFLQR